MLARLLYGFRISIVFALIVAAVATLLGVLVLNEPFGVSTVVGFAMILGGSWLASSRTPELATA